MTVEMNPPGSRSHNKSGLPRREGSGKSRSSRKSEECGRRLSDDVHSLNSWSETLNLSTSSSSESGSRRESVSSRHGCQEARHRSKPSPLHKAAFSKQEQHSKKSAHTSSQHKQQNVDEANFRPSSRELEFEASSLSSLSLSNYEILYDMPIIGHDLTDFDSYSQAHDYEYDVPLQHCHQNAKASYDKNDCDSVSKNKVFAMKSKSESVTPVKYQAQILYPNQHSDPTHPNIQGEPYTSKQSLTPPSANVKTNNDPTSSQPERPHYFNSMNPHSKQPRYKQTQRYLEDREPPRPFSSLPNNYPCQQGSEISQDNLFPIHKVERIQHQSSAPFGERLHKSQPSIASQPLLKHHAKSSSDLESLRQSFEHRLEPENVKTKVKSVWNNIKYGWTFKSKPNIKYDSPLFMLGQCYHKRKDDSSTEPEENFLKDFVSRIWFTYRSNFYPIPGTKLSTDCGWGCMLRSGQMLIAQCLVTHYLGRDWRLYDTQTETQFTFYREIIRWFSDPVDTPSDKTPFCLHHLANFGRAYSKNPGEWYGPASVAYIFRDAFTRASQTIPILSQLCIYVAQDCTVYIDDVNMLGTAKTAESIVSASKVDTNVQVDGAAVSTDREMWLRSIIILIPMRLGGEVMNEIYIPCVKSLLSHDNCMGIIGGKPRHSLYFLGWQDDKLIYLDPHWCREAVDTSVKDFRLETFHCMTPRKLSISKMDPSCTVGFYIRNRADFDKFVREIQEFVSPPKQKGTYPLFIFSKGSHQESSARHTQTSVDRRVRVTHYHYNENGQRQRTFSRDSEEFVML